VAEGAQRYGWLRLVQERLGSPHHDQHRRFLLEFLRRFLNGVGFVGRLNFTKSYYAFDRRIDIKNGVNRIRFE
jgi:hypothetical protein